MRRIVLDISRLISRAAHAVPTGIDRVEMAYAEALLARQPDHLDFAAVHPLGRAAILPRAPAQAFVEQTSLRWRTAGADVAPLRAAARRLLGSVLVRSALPGGRRRDATYLLTSHHHLDRPDLVATLRDRCGAFVCFIHDLIPAEYPEYARPQEAERHRRRARTAAGLSDGVIVNSADTARAFAPYLVEAGRTPPVLVALLGADPVTPVPAAPPDGPPTFLLIGTIEPRKNHLLMLQVWRRLAARGEAAPRLVLVGRRGWENEMVIDMIERCTALRGLVEEHNTLSDPELRALMARSRALLLPTFAEGYGLPLLEALASGVPALCSDIPVLREVGGDVPEYLDPLDGPGWAATILDYAAPDSGRRAAQLARLRHWRPPSWDTHMDAALELIERAGA